MNGLPITEVDADFTRRLSCRQGDLLLWMRPGGLMSVLSGPEWDMPDCWFLADGTSVLITNRSMDLPAWFELHPTETGGDLAFQAMRRVERGWSPPDPVDAPNIWRVRAGDRVAFTGKSRPGVTAYANGLIEIFDFSQNALIVGEAQRGDLNEMLSFGEPGDTDPAEEQHTAARAAVELIRRLGMPRSMAVDWYLDR